MKQAMFFMAKEQLLEKMNELEKEKIQYEIKSSYDFTIAQLTPDAPPPEYFEDKVAYRLSWEVQE